MEPARVWISDADCRLEEFRRQVERHARLAHYPLASAVHHNVLTYQGDDIRRAAAEPDSRKALMAEWARALLDGPGILRFQNAFADHAVVDAANDQFFAMIAEQRASNANAGNNASWHGIHIGGINVLILDGGVHFKADALSGLPNTAAPLSWQLAVHPSDGRPMHADWIR